MITEYAVRESLACQFDELFDHRRAVRSTIYEIPKENKTTTRRRMPGPIVTQCIHELHHDVKFAMHIADDIQRTVRELH